MSHDPHGRDDKKGVANGRHHAASFESPTFDQGNLLEESEGFELKESQDTNESVSDHSDTDSPTLSTSQAKSHKHKSSVLQNDATIESRSARPIESNQNRDQVFAGSFAGSATRFKIVRSHAKGGLGEVFLARDQELDREVALKEIQSHYADDTAARLRFETEACITGGLEHPGVVPVYGFGHYPDGRPFYAMRFIRGESLKDEITAFHDNGKSDGSTGEHGITLHQLLRRFVDACNAIAYAHSRGVLHRDIKPANIMLGKFGETLVVDWGLAKSVGRDEHYGDTGEITLLPSSGSVGTASVQGSAMGTPSFMSPEQASGNLDRISAASDIFSLGATLYTILVGKPPYTGRSARDILDRAKNCDFQPPKSVAPQTPGPLNSICLKAMSASIDDRYETALELGHDVEHYLAGELVSAHNENITEQMARWIRQHRTLAASAVVLLGTLTMASGIGAFFINLEKNKTQSAYELVTEEQRKTAEALALVKEEQSKTAAALTELEQQQIRTRAALDSETQARRQTREALNIVTDDLIGELMARQFELSAADRKFLKRVLDQFEGFTNLEGDAPEELSIRADGYFRVANLQRRLGEFDGAVQAYELAKSHWLKLLETSSDDPSMQTTGIQELAATESNLAMLQTERGLLSEAVEGFQSAAQHLENLLNESKSGAVPVSTVDAEKQVALLDKMQLELARVYSNLGNTTSRLGQNDVATQYYDQSLERLEQLQAIPAEVVLRQRGTILGNKAGHLARNPSHLTEATEAYQQAIDSLRESLDANVGSASAVRFELSAFVKNLASLKRQQNLGSEAETLLREAISIQTDLVDEFPLLASYRQELGRSRAMLGRILARENQEAAEQEFQAAHRIAADLTEQFSDRIPFKQDLANLLMAWGSVSTSDAARAERRFAESLLVRQSLVEKNPGNPVLAQELLVGSINFANWLRESQRYENAIETYLPLLTSLDEREVGDDRLTRIVLFGLGDSYSKSERWAEGLLIWTRLCENHEVPDWQPFEMQRALCLIRTGEVAEGLAAAEAVVEKAEQAVLLYDMACCFAVAAGAEANDDTDERNRYLEKGLEYLQTAADKGFFEDETMRKHAAEDDDLEALRGTSAFIEFCEKIGIGK